MVKGQNYWTPAEIKEGHEYIKRNFERLLFSYVTVRETTAVFDEEQINKNLKHYAAAIKLVKAADPFSVFNGNGKLNFKPLQGSIKLSDEDLETAHSLSKGALEKALNGIEKLENSSLYGKAQLDNLKKLYSAALRYVEQLNPVPQLKQTGPTGEDEL